MRLALGSFEPDLDAIVQGFMERQIAAQSQSLLTDCNWVYSTLGGFKNMPALAQIGPALPSKAFGAFAAEIQNAYLIVLATNNQLYFFNNGILVSQALTLANTANPWSFTVYGTDLLATDGVDPVQVSINGGAFGALAGSPPIFSIVEATDFSLFGIVPISNEYWFTLNDTVWTPSIATATGFATLSSTAGIIVAAKELLGGISMFKRNALHYGTYQGPPFYWGFQTISNKVGTLGPNSVVTVDTMQYFVGPDDFYQFDGYSLSRIPNNLRKWFFANMDSNFAANIFATYDQPRGQVVFWFPSINANPKGVFDSNVAFSTLTGKWVKSQSIDGSAIIDIPVTGLITASQPWTWAKFQNTYNTYANTPNLTYGSALFSGSTTPVVAVIDGNHIISTLTGAFGAPHFSSLPAFITTGDLGDKKNVYRLNRAKPGYLSLPSTQVLASPSKLRVFSTYVPGTDYSESDLIDLAPTGYFDFVHADRLQRLRIGWYSDSELSDLDVDISFAGKQ
jgi:hypothetical protein